MTSLLRSLLAPSRADPEISIEDWIAMMQSQQLTAPIQTLAGDKTAEIGGNFAGLIEGAYRANGVVFACMLVRMMLFSEARMQFRRRASGRPGELFGSAELARLEEPWPGGTTGDLLARMIQDADLAGNCYIVRGPDGLRRLRPDWVTIIVGSNQGPDDPRIQADARLVGYMYHPGGRAAGHKPVSFLPEWVAHFAPIPDPDFIFRGMSWLVPVLRELASDQAMSVHKEKFFQNAASPNMVVSMDAGIGRETFDKWIDAFESQNVGYLNAWKTLYLGAGAKAEVVGSNMRQADLGSLQPEVEVRIAAAAGVPPIIAGLSRGLDASTYSNYGQAKRRFADGTMRPLWRNACGSLARLVNVPANAELWYDDRDIPFLAEDVKDAAEVRQANATAIRTLVDGGFDPDSAVAAVTSGDLSRLTHSGLVPVQLQKAGQSGQPAPQT